MDVLARLFSLVIMYLSALCVSSVAEATEANNQVRGETFLPAKLIEDSKRWGGSYPGNALLNNRSGVVELVYIVNAEGKPSEIVVGSYSDRKFIRQSINALKKYRYRPALRNGKPVSSLNRSVMTFIGRNMNSNAVDKFDKNYELFSREFTKSEPQPKLLIKHLKSMNKARQANLSMQGVLNYAEMMYADRYLSLDDKIEAAYVADIYRFSGFSVEKKFEVKKKLVSWLVASGRYSDAVDAILDLNVGSFRPVIDMDLWTSPPNVKPSDLYLSEYKANDVEFRKLLNQENGPFAEVIREIEEIKHSDKSFASLFEVSSRGYVLRGLLKNRFTIDQIQGQIDELVFRCQEKFYKMKFGIDQDYYVPEAWGKCHLQIKGSSGTKARLIES